MVHRKRNDIWPCNAVYAGLQSARKDHRGVGLISDVLPLGLLWYGAPNAIGNAIEYAKHRGRSNDSWQNVSGCLVQIVDFNQGNSRGVAYTANNSGVVARL